MQKTGKRIFALCMIFILFVFPCQAAESGELYYSYIHEFADYLCEDAKFPAEKSVLIDAALKANLTRSEDGLEGMLTEMVNCLDEHSSYMTAEELEAFMEQTVNGEFVGIGIVMSTFNDSSIIISTLPDSPAEGAGIMPGDILIAVDGQSLQGLSTDAVQDLIRGEAGTQVTVTLQRGTTQLELTMERALVADQAVSYSIEDGIGYLLLENFSMVTVPMVEEALDAFAAANVTNVILDLRNNLGGVVDVALDICRMFTPRGAIMRVEYANAEKNEVYYNETNAKGKYRLAVLVNGATASAAELLAGSIMDTKSGVIIGENTYGKGTMQNIRMLATGGALRLTIAEYKTAGGRSVHHTGIKPNILVENTYEIPDISYMQELKLNCPWKEGDTDQGVLALEERLVFLGYLEKADTVFAADTAAAVRMYQAINDLPVTGVADIYTQIRLDNADYETPRLRDNQLEKAKEYLHEAR